MCKSASSGRCGWTRVHLVYRLIYSESHYAAQFFPSCPSCFFFFFFWQNVREISFKYSYIQNGVQKLLKRLKYNMMKPAETLCKDRSRRSLVLVLLGNKEVSCSRSPGSLT